MAVLEVRGWLVDRDVGIDRTFVLLCNGSTVGESWGAWTVGSVRREWWRLAGFHPPPSLPPGRGEGRIGERVRVGRVPACAGMTESFECSPRREARGERGYGEGRETYSPTAALVGVE